MKKVWFYVPFNAEQDLEEITMRSEQFWKWAKREKQILASTRFGSNWDFASRIARASWIACCPSTFCTWFPYYHNKLNQVISIYLLKIFCFCCSWADIIYLQQSRLGMNVNFLSCFYQQKIKQLSITCLLSDSWVARYWYWKFKDSINVVLLHTLCF